MPNDMRPGTFVPLLIGELLLLGCAVATGRFSSDVHAQQLRTVADGVYSTAQAQNGQGLYARQCASCHGAMLQGEMAPPLSGSDFLVDFSDDPLAKLASKIKNTMPSNDP